MQCMSEWLRGSKFKDHSNGYTPGELGRNERTSIIPVKPINKKSKKASKKSTQKNALIVTNPSLPVDLNNEKPKPSKFKKRHKSMNGKKRADILKKNYPDMKNVPNSLTLNQQAALIQVYHRSRTGQPQAEQGLLSRDETLARKGSRVAALPEVTEEGRREIARNLGGLSSSNPIFID